MTTDQVGAGSETAAPPTDDQLHGKACIGADCTVTAGLTPAGHVYTKTSGAPLGWAVKACPTHAPKESIR
ncbi:hypothetical protein [Streptomyces sp. CB03911]|uniref:hypothetical protein n=1 Tax=Streptomyces sp. CB03911 TaxID=1804758 RepID=UPI0018FED4CD|nr:hypothetical protein [Streptomyces sp. CB03911]